jgi:hypothetical protein
MRPIWFVRVAAAAAALFAASFISLASAPGTGLFTANPPLLDRSFKSDRLPLTAPADSPKIGSKIEPEIELKTERKIESKIRAPAAPTQQSREKMPVGCDGAFSPISSPRQANVFRRCTV